MRSAPGTPVHQHRLDSPAGSRALLLPQWAPAQALGTLSGSHIPWQPEHSGGRCCEWPLRRSDSACPSQGHQGGTFSQAPTTYRGQPNPLTLEEVVGASLEEVVEGWMTPTL